MIGLESNRANERLPCWPCTNAHLGEVIWNSVRLLKSPLILIIGTLLTDGLQPRWASVDGQLARFVCLPLRNVRARLV